MSLLLDALKRAEQEKLARQRQGAGAEAPAESPASAGLELESVATAAPAAAKDAGAKRDAEREGAKTVFAAKLAEAQPGPGKNKAVLAIAGVAVLLLLAGGGYVWYELSRSSVLAPPARVATGPRPVIAAPVQSEAPKTDAVLPAIAVLKPESVPAPAPRAKPQPKAAEQLVMNLLKDAAATPAPPLKLSRTIDAPRVPPDVSQGYDALRRGDLASARRSYESALAADPTNVDALLGLATVFARAGERATATRNYRRALELDPKNASALAGLAALADFSRPEGLEAQLRADISRNPQSPALHYTLGALLSSQARWTEAQVSFFEAHRLDPGNADIVYNLAVSLDHLGQARLAADFYQRALGAAQQQNAQFDKGRVTRRIAELKP
jgi:Tfp pilus assembly protein PilF